MSCSFGPGQSLDDMIDEIRRLRANVLPRGLAGQLEVQATAGEVAWCCCENVKENLKCQSQLGFQNYCSFIADLM